MHDGFMPKPHHPLCNIENCSICQLVDKNLQFTDTVTPGKFSREADYQQKFLRSLSEPELSDYKSLSESEISPTNDQIMRENRRRSHKKFRPKRRRRYENPGFFPSDYSGSYPGSGPCGPPSDDQVYYIRILYLIFIILWLGMAYLLYSGEDLVEIVILCIPFIVFAIGFINCGVITKDVEDTLFDVNYISIAVLVMVPLLTWLSKDYNTEGRYRFVTIIIIAMMLALISLIDIWVPRKWLSLVKHFKSICETLAVIMIIFALYTYYIESPHAILRN